MKNIDEAKSKLRTQYSKGELRKCWKIATINGTYMQWTPSAKTTTASPPDKK